MTVKSSVSASPRRRCSGASICASGSGVARVKKRRARRSTTTSRAAKTNIAHLLTESKFEGEAARIASASTSRWTRSTTPRLAQLARALPCRSRETHQDQRPAPSTCWASPSAVRGQGIPASTSEGHGDPNVSARPRISRQRQTGSARAPAYDEGQALAPRTAVLRLHRQHNLRIQWWRAVSTLWAENAPTDGRVVSTLSCRRLPTTDPVSGDGASRRAASDIRTI